MKTYCLNFKLKKYPKEHGFITIVSAEENKLQDVIKERSEYFEELYGTPVKFIKSKEIIENNIRANINK